MQTFKELINNEVYFQHLEKSRSTGTKMHRDVSHTGRQMSQVK